MLGLPKIMYEFQLPGVFHTSGSSMLITKFLPFLMVILLIPVTGLSPILAIAFLNFFSPLLDLGSNYSVSFCSRSSLSCSACGLWSWLQFSECTCSAGGSSVLTSSAIVILDQIKQQQILFVYMPSEQQYYQAKAFLIAYRDALATLQQIAHNRYTLHQYHSINRYLNASAQKAQVHIEGNRLQEGTFFNESRIRKLGLFSKKLFTQKLMNWEGASNTKELKKVLQAYL